jgi:MFS superfamily sulfate permease-like transporter
MDHHSELEMAVNPRKRSKIEEEVLLNKEAIVMARGPEIRRHSSPVNLNEQLKSPSENFTDTFLPNLVSGLSVAFVNLPMCMAFASAARLSPTNGIISAFWSSLFVWFSDSKYSVISVAMSIALLTGPMVTSYGEDGYHMALFFSGLIIMFLLFTKLYKYMIIIPKCVMDGFLAGCVLGVFVEQLPTIFMVDFEKPAEGESSEGPMISMFVQGMTNVYMQRQDVNWLSVFIYFAVTICLYVLMKKAPSRPWVLFMCIFGILIGVVEDYVGEDRRPLLRLSEKYSNIKLRFFTFPSIGSRSIKSMITNPQFYFDTLSMSMLIILEGMIAWGMLGVTTDQTFTSTPKNILVLIYCNLSCIVTGTMGASFVYARSILNYQTGAKNQFACIINGIICLGVGFLFFSLFSKMPSVVLEGILMGLELKVVRVKKLIFAFKHDFKFFITSMSVIFAMLFTRGSNAIFIGLFVYLAMFTKELMTPQNEVTFTRKGEVGGDAYLESSSKKNFVNNF